MESCSEIIECGFTKPLPRLTTVDKIDLIQTVTLHYVLLRTKAEMDQFAEGLRALGVLDVIRKYPELLRLFFTNKGMQTLTAGLRNH